MTVACVPGIIAFLRDPVNSAVVPYSDAPLAITVGLHAYHCVSYWRTLTPLDWAHHIVSNMLVSGLAFPFRLGPVVNWVTFFVCGLPGGIDYYLLFLTKMGSIQRLTEKRINVRAYAAVENSAKCVAYGCAYECVILCLVPTCSVDGGEVSEVQRTRKGQAFHV